MAIGRLQQKQIPQPKTPGINGGPLKPATISQAEKPFGNLPGRLQKVAQGAKDLFLGDRTDYGQDISKNTVSQSFQRRGISSVFNPLAVFGIGKTDEERFYERFNALRSAGTDEVRAKSIASTYLGSGSKSLDSKSILLRSSQKSKRQELSLNETEKKALVPISVSEFADQLFGVLDIPTGFVGKLGVKTFANIAKSTDPLKIFNLLKGENAVSKVPDEVLRPVSDILSNITDEKEVARVINNLEFKFSQVPKGRIQRAKAEQLTAGPVEQKSLELDPKSDIPLQVAIDAYRGTSFNPEKSGASRVEEYTTLVKDYYNELLPLATTPEKKQTLDTMFSTFRDGLKKRKLSILSSESRTISPMISGRGNFPVTRNNKILDSLNNKYREQDDYINKSINKIKNTLSVKTLDEKESLLQSLLKEQANMKEANKIIKKNISEKETYKQLKALGFSDKTIVELVKGDYMGRKGFPSFRMTSINNRIKTLSKSASPSQTKEMVQPEKITTVDVAKSLADEAKKYKSKTLSKSEQPRINTKLEKMAESSRSFDDFVQKTGVTEGSLEATVKNKGYNSAEEFYNDVTKPFEQDQSQISDADRLIAQGKIRVVSRDGRDVYQYKVGSDWRNARTDESAVKAVLKMEAPKQPIELPIELEEKAISLELKAETLENSPYNHPDNRFLVDREGRIRELGDIKTIKLIVKLEDRMAEAGISDPTNYAAGLEKYLKDKKKLAVEQKVVNEEIKVAKKKAIEEINQRRSELIEKMSVNELKSLDDQAQITLMENHDAVFDGAKTIRQSVIESKPQTPVTKKVNGVDYLRTPDRVLKKIGLEKESKLLRRQYEKYVKELPINLQKITDWYELFPEKGFIDTITGKKTYDREQAGERIFKFIDGEDKSGIVLTELETKVAKEIQAYLEKWADRLGLPKHERIANYISHIFEEELLQKEFDEELAKIIDDKIPGSVYNPFLQKRLGMLGYKQDVWKALDAYTKRATRKVHMDVALRAFEDAASTLELTSWNFVKKYLDRVNMRPTEADTLIDNFLKSIPRIGYRMGQRPTLAISRTLRKFSYRGVLGLNLSSAVKNLSQGSNTFALLGPKYTGLGYLDLFKKDSIKELYDYGVLDDSFVQDRTVSGMKKRIKAFDETLFFFFDTAEKINRGAAYHGAKRKALEDGLSLNEAIEKAKETVRKTQFNFTTIDTPLFLSSDVMKTVLQLQSYTLKQTEFLLEMAGNKDFVGLLRYALMGVIFISAIGKMFGMEYKDLIPMFRFSSPPATKAITETAKALADAPDEYGNKRTTGQKFQDVGGALTLLVPGYAQGKKTYEGIKAVFEGGSFDKADRLQFTVEDSLFEKTKVILFGKYAAKDAEAYFNKRENNKINKNRIQPIYDEVQNLKLQGKESEAKNIVNELTDEEYEIYKDLLSTDKAKKSAQGRKNVLPIYQKAQKLKEEGKIDKAKELVNSLSDEEYEYYQQIKKQLDKDAKAEKGEIPEYIDNESSTEKSLIGTVFTYATAIGADPVVAFDRIFTGQRIRRVDNGVVIIERMPLKDSQALKERAKATDEEILDHFIPLQLGGSNKQDNLLLVPKDLWELYTPVENKLGKLLRDKKINKKEAIDLITDFKEGNITAQSIMDM